MKNLTGKEVDIIAKCIINQIAANSKAKELVSDYEISLIIDGKNEELRELLDKITLKGRK